MKLFNVQFSPTSSFLIGKHNQQRLLILTRLMRAQHPPWSVLARRFRTYLKYICSRAKRTAANRMPDISSRKADKNCSRARGSLDLCSCFPGLHVPVIQYRRNLSRSPAIRIPASSSTLYNIIF